MGNRHMIRKIKPMNSETYPIYEAQVGALGRVAFFKDPQSRTYCFTYFNGADYTQLNLSEDAAYFTWLFIGMEHPELSISTFTPSKKAGRSKPKKRPSKPLTKKKAK